MIRHGSRPKPLPVDGTGHEFWKESQEANRRKAHSLYYTYHWLYCDYKLFLKHLEQREREGIYRKS